MPHEKQRSFRGFWINRAFMKKVDGIQDIWGIWDSDEIKWDTE